MSKYSSPAYKEWAFARRPRRNKWSRNTRIGKWRILLADVCREKGYIHTSGRWAGHINTYRLSIESGLSETTLRHFMNGTKSLIGPEALAALCDALQCQPSDLMIRIYDHIPESALLDDYALPSDL
jgi:DNA-binding Xre family transcriptional regulator